MYSMTGYSYIERSNDQFSYSIEIKTLNSKFCEIFVNLPKALRKKENDYTQVLKNEFTRGKIVLTIEISDWLETVNVSINKNIVKNLYKDIRKIEDDLNVKNYFSGDILFSMDDVFHANKRSISEKSYNDIIQSLNEAIQLTKKMQKKEGSVTGKDIEKSLNFISQRTAEVKNKCKNNSKVMFAKLKKTIESISGASVDDNRLYTELAILTDKLDINEEIVRLNIHIKKLKSVLGEEGQIGKKIDFLAQELFREANTIASKANNAEISHIIVDIKNHIDKIREQSRNII